MIAVMCIWIHRINFPCIYVHSPETQIVSGLLKCHFPFLQLLLIYIYTYYICMHMRKGFAGTNSLMSSLKGVKENLLLNFRGRAAVHLEEK